MKTNLETLENSRVRLDIEVDSQQWEEALQKAYRKVVKSISVPGFRKGKVPRPILERQYGKAVLYEDAIDFVFPEAYSKALDEHELQPVGQPDVDVKNLDSLETDDGLAFTVEVDVYPTVELGEYKGLTAEKTEVSVTDEEVQEVLDNMRQRQGELVVVDSRDDAQQGDFAVIDFTGYLNDEPFSGGAAEDHMLELGSGQFIPGFEEQVVGMKVGENKDIQVTFPEEYHAENLAGQEVVFKVHLKELKERLLPDLDDEFAKDVSEHDSLDALKEDIRADLLKDKERRAKNQLEDQLAEALIANSTAVIPEAMIQRQSEFMLEEFERNLMYQGMRLEHYLEATKTDKESLMENFRPDAERQVQRELLLDAVAEKEGLAPTDEEVDIKINEFVEQSSQPEESRRMWESRKEGLEASMRLEQAMDFLIEHASLTEKAAE